MTFLADDRLIVQHRFARWPVVQLEELPPAVGGRRPAVAVIDSLIYPVTWQPTPGCRWETSANFTQPEHCADLARKGDAEAEFSTQSRDGRSGRPSGMVPTGIGPAEIWRGAQQ
jgi:hypothetical protein